MWVIKEHREIKKILSKLPRPVLKKYELWKEIASRHGPSHLRKFPGFHDERLKGKRGWQRSSRLNLQYRVIYEIKGLIFTVFVLEITPHKY